MPARPARSLCPPRAALLAVVLATAMTAASCGDGGSDPAPDAGAGSDTTATAAPTTPAASSPPLPTSAPTGPPNTPSDGGSKVRLVGEIVAVRASHVVLEDGNGMRWALVGDGVRSLRVDQRVQVTGTSRPGSERDGHPLVVVERDATTPRGS